MTKTDLPDISAIMCGEGQPISRPAAALTSDQVRNLEAEIETLFNQFEVFTPADMPTLDEVFTATPMDPPTDLNDFHVIVASGLAYTLAGAKGPNKGNWPLSFEEHLANADNWAKANFNALHYGWFKRAVANLTETTVRPDAI